MNEKLKVRSFDDTTLCGWCGIPFGSANLVRQLVCIRCYELLINANLSNEEIFGSAKDKSEGKKKTIQSLIGNHNKE